MNAQDKYEFMIIEYVGTSSEIALSIDGIEFKKEKIEPIHIKSYSNANPLISKVKEYQAKDWELMNFQILTGVYYAFLRKKIADKK
jgi:hypothetical protein